MHRVKDLVSVVIPCYNQGKYLSEAVNSILNQTYQDFEVIIVDDGSDDEKSLEVMKCISNENLNVTLCRKENGGPASARNYGIKKSNGEFILNLDADDKYHPEFLYKAINIFNCQPKAGVITSDFYLFSDDMDKQYREVKGRKLTDFLAGNECIASSMFRFQCWLDAGGYDESKELIGFEDWDFWLNVTKNGWMIYPIPEALRYYRDTTNSLYDKVRSNKPEKVKYLVEKHVQIYRENVVDVLYQKEMEIKKLEQEISNTHDLFIKSPSYLVGNFLLYPFKKIFRLLSKDG